jgi:hypothetical protein
MACTYNYKGVEHSSYESLSQAVRADIVAGEVSPEGQLNQWVYKLNDEYPLDVAEDIIRGDVESMVGTSEFIQIIEHDGGAYMVINEDLANEAFGSVKTFTNLDGSKSDFDLAKLTETFKSTGKLPTNPAARSAVLARAMQESVNSLVEKAKQDTLPREDSLMDRLKDFATAMGINVTTLEDYLESYEQRTNVPASVQALADLLEKVIALSNTNDIANFTEEIAHFAVEYFKGQEVFAEMLEDIPLTAMYKQYAEHYRKIYGDQLSGEALEQKVRKEILGKILAQKIQDNFKQNHTNIAERGIFARLKELIGQFMDLFTMTPGNREFFVRFGATLDQISGQILNEEGYSAFSPVESREIYYSMNPQRQQQLDTFKRIHELLYSRYRSLANNKELRRQRQAQLQSAAEKVDMAYYAGATQA